MKLSETLSKALITFVKLYVCYFVGSLIGAIGYAFYLAITGKVNPSKKEIVNE